MKLANVKTQRKKAASVNDKKIAHKRKWRKTVDKLP